METVEAKEDMLTNDRPFVSGHMKYTKTMLKNVIIMFTKKNFQVMLFSAIGPATSKMMSARYRPHILTAVPWLRIWVGNISALSGVSWPWMVKHALHLHVEKLACITKRTPEGCDEQENEEDGRILTSPIRGAKVCSLKRGFTNETNEDTSQSDE